MKKRPGRHKRMAGLARPPAHGEIEEVETDKFEVEEEGNPGVEIKPGPKCLAEEHPRLAENLDWLLEVMRPVSMNNTPSYQSFLRLIEARLWMSHPYNFRDK